MDKHNPDAMTHAEAAPMVRISDLRGGRDRTGFTLVELLIAMVVVAIIASVAVPAYTANVRKGRTVDAQRVLMSLAQTEEIYRFQNGSYTNSIASLTALGWVNDSATNSAGTQYYPTANITIQTVAPPGPTFLATIQGSIGGAQADIRTIDNNGVLTNTQNGWH
jgi:type IV pilus assembly protein PilE